MKYILISVIALAVIGGVAGLYHLYRVSARNTKEMSEYLSGNVAVNKNFDKVLVVYFSLGGRTRDIAERIQARTGSDIYKIKTAEEIKKGPLLYLKSKRDIKNGSYPELQGDMPDMEKYDIIFVGSPVWWYTAATPVSAFLQKADFKGKKVVPFTTQGSNAGTFLEDFGKMAKNAKVSNYRSFNNMGKKYDKAVDNKIAVWLNGLAP